MKKEITTLYVTGIHFHYVISYFKGTAIVLASRQLATTGYNYKFLVCFFLQCCIYMLIHFT